MGYLWDFMIYFALLVFRINSRMPSPGGARSRLSGFHWCLKYQKALKGQRNIMSHNDGLKFILKIITNIKLIGCFYINYLYNF